MNWIFRAIPCLIVLIPYICTINHSLTEYEHWKSDS